MKTGVLGGHLPWAQVVEHLDLMHALDLVPEIAVKGPDLDTLDPLQRTRLAQALTTANIRPRIHAPFFDLNPGALDPLIRQATRQRFEQTLDLARDLQAELVILHPGVDKWRYPRLEKTWLSLALDFFPPLVNQAAEMNCRLAIENIYEESPENLVLLVDGLSSKFFGHCFDIGHWHLFGKRPLAEWLDAIGAQLFHLHLHDNHGRADEHLPVGDGTIDFEPLQRHLSRAETLPSITLEAHQPEHLQRSLNSVTRLLAAVC